LYVWIGYYNSHTIALASVNAKPASEREYREFHNIVEGLALASGLPKPQLYVMNDNNINAFASGRDPRHAVICVTTGALQKLDKHELEGVLAHEMSHIANYDIRFMTLTAVLVGMIAIISEIFLRSLWHSSLDNDNKKGNAIFIIIGIIFAILAPIVVQLVQLAISRRREYTADASAVKFTRTPTGLIKALKKIQHEHTPTQQEKHHYNKAVAPLFISDPFKKLSGLFQTHPPLQKRIAILERM
ncbi:MAG: hypothetical protein RL557_172, partial [archaeon]